MSVKKDAAGLLSRSRAAELLKKSTAPKPTSWLLKLSQEDYEFVAEIAKQIAGTASGVATPLKIVGKNLVRELALDVSCETVARTLKGMADDAKEENASQK